MNKTKIEWVKNPDGTQGYTSNPVRGECPVDCSYCYVKPLRAHYGWHKDIRFYPEELENIRKRKKPCGIFLGSVIELFHEKTIIYVPEIMETIKACPQHRFYLLTKQPQNLIKWSPFPENCWIGVSVDGTDNAPLGRMIYTGFDKIQATVKFISFEPLLAQTRLDPRDLSNCGINWLIIGAQTKPYKPPKIEWIQEIVGTADKAGVPVFLKDNLAPLIIPKFMEAPNLYSDLIEKSEKGRLHCALRQEVPCKK